LGHRLGLTGHVTATTATCLPVRRLLRSPHMRRAVCPGSYDPVTNGHIDIIERAAGIFDEVIVAVLVNKTKKSLFTVDERLDMLRSVTSHLPGVRVDSWHGLLVDYCRQHEVAVIAKGLRAVSDFDYELQMAQMNQQLSGVETMFMPTNPLWSFLSSSLVKEVANYGGDVAHLVPELVHHKLLARFAEQRAAN
jgi:pantetheine-phosphate adenylyltransferase